MHSEFVLKIYGLSVVYLSEKNYVITKLFFDMSSENSLADPISEIQKLMESMYITEPENV